MSDDKIAVIALVLRGYEDILRTWIESRPVEIELVETMRHDTGIVLVSLDDLARVRNGNFLALPERIRRRVSKMHVTAAGSEPTKAPEMRTEETAAKEEQ